MLNHLFDLYCDLITLDWLARKLGSMGRALGCYLFVAGLLWFYFGVLPEKPGRYYASMGNVDLRGTHEATAISFYCYSLFTLGISAIGLLLFCLPQITAMRSPRLRLRYRHPIAFSRLTKRYRATKDPWICLPCRIGHRAFGDASLHPFDWYLTRKSPVHAPTVDHICDFLLQCRYMSDREQFGLADFWQHPVVLEKRKRGDCDDFALWAWRKLCEANIDAEFVVGQWCPKNSASPGRLFNHAWVIFREKGQTFLLETTGKNKAQMVSRLAEVRDEYIPYFSVNHSSRTSIYGGYVDCMEQLLERHSAAVTAAGSAVVLASKTVL